MYWEILAIWAIVLGVVIWFLRDERKKRQQDQRRAFTSMRRPRAGEAAPAIPPGQRVDAAELDAARRRFFELFSGQTQ